MVKIRRRRRQRKRRKDTEVSGEQGEFENVKDTEDMCIDMNGKLNVEERSIYENRVFTAKDINGVVKNSEIENIEIIKLVEIHNGF